MGHIVIWAIFNDAGMLAGLPNFEIADVPFNGSLEGMVAELELPDR